MEDIMLKAFREMGIAAGLALGIFLLLCAVLWAAYELIKKLIEQFNNERKQWAGVIENINASILEHNQQAREFYNNTRNEHDNQQKAYEKMIENMEEQGKVLASINGCKHE